MGTKIGFTERGDAGRDLSWYEKCKEGECDGIIVITKSITTGCRERVMTLYSSGFPVILHCGCTGWGSTILEPNVPSPSEQLDVLAAMLKVGFPADHVVLRIDPIIPTKEGLKRVKRVLDGALNRSILPLCRVRVSIIDEYRHVKNRFIKAGLVPVYGPTAFGPSDEQMQATAGTLAPYAEKYGIKFETCAEPRLTNYAPHAFVAQGCVSELDLKVMGLEYDKAFINPQNRHGCLCLGCKKELLENKSRCPNGCLYCYWKEKTVN